MARGRVGIGGAGGLRFRPTGRFNIKSAGASFLFTGTSGSATLSVFLPSHPPDENRRARQSSSELGQHLARPVEQVLRASYHGPPEVSRKSATRVSHCRRRPSKATRKATIRIPGRERRIKAHAVKQGPESQRALWQQVPKCSSPLAGVFFLPAPLPEAEDWGWPTGARRPADWSYSCLCKYARTSYTVCAMSNSALTTKPYPVFATVYCEGRSAPVFNGVTQVPLVSEPKLRNVFKSAFAHVRKVALCILAQNTPLGASRPQAPAFFERAQGVFRFTKEQAMTPFRPMRVKSVVRKSKKRVKKALANVVRKSKAKSSTKVSRRPRGHSTGVKAQRKRSRAR